VHALCVSCVCKQRNHPLHIVEASTNFSGLTVICPASEVVKSEMKVLEIGPCTQRMERLRTHKCNFINWQRIERLSNECNSTNFTIGSVLEDPTLLEGYLPKGSQKMSSYVFHKLLSTVTLSKVAH
jgi:hypothetical protein